MEQQSPELRGPAALVDELGKDMSGSLHNTVLHFDLPEHMVVNLECELS